MNPMINQQGVPVFEEYLYSWSMLNADELSTIVFELLDRLNLDAIRTNATKHGNTEILLVSKE